MAQKHEDDTPERPVPKPWKETKKDKKILYKLQEIKAEVAEHLRNWGLENGISDLSLQHIMTLPKNPDAKVSYYWQDSKSDWYRFRDGDAAPRWLVELTNRKEYKYPDGRLVTDAMRARFKGRGGTAEKVTSFDD
jgi:hypothetical protein